MKLYTKNFVVIAIICSLVILIPTIIWGFDKLWLYVIIAYVLQYILQKKYLK